MYAPRLRLSLHAERAVAIFVHKGDYEGLGGVRLPVAKGILGLCAFVYVCETLCVPSTNLAFSVCVVR